MGKGGKHTRRLLRAVIGVTLFAAILLFVTALVFMIPSVQTKAAKKTAALLSEKLQTEISIEKLRLYWNLDFQAEGLRIEDRRHQPMFAVGSLKSRLPSYNRNQGIWRFRGIDLEDVLVYTAKYKGDTTNNMKMLFALFASDKEKKPVKLLFEDLRMKNGTYIWYHEQRCKEDVTGVWNYDHIRLQQIDADIRRITVADGECQLDIRHLDCKEHSGFTIRNMQTLLTVSSQKLYLENTIFDAISGSHIDMDFRFDFDSWQQYADFQDSVIFRCQLRPSLLHATDLTYFSPALHGIEPIAMRLQGKVENSLSHLEIKQFSCYLNDSTHLRGNLFTEGIQHGRTARWDAEIDELAIVMRQVDGWSLPGGKPIQLPEPLKKLVVHQAVADFHGTFDDFSTDVELSGNLGGLHAYGTCDSKKGIRHYNAHLLTRDLQLQELLHSPLLDKLTAQGEISGKGGNIEDYRVNVASLLVNGREVRHVKISGDMEDKRLGIQGDFRDPELQGSVKGFLDLQEERIGYGMVDIKRFNLSAFHLFREDSAAVVALQSKVHWRGGKEESGTDISLYGVTYTQNGRSVAVPPFQIAMESEAGKGNLLRLNSRPLQASLEGNLAYRELLPCLQEMLRTHLPHSFAATNSPLPDSAAFDASLHLKSRVEALELLLPQVRIGEGLSAQVHYRRAEGGWETDLQAPRLAYKNMETENCRIRSHAAADTLHAAVSCRKFIWNNKDSLSHLQRVEADIACFRDTLSFAAHTTEQPENALGFAFQGLLRLLSPEQRQLHFQEGRIRLQDSRFVLDTHNQILWNGNGMLLRDLRFVSGRQAFAVEGWQGKRKENHITLQAKQLDISNFETLLKPYHISLNGIASGGLQVQQQAEQLRLTSDLQVDSFAFNGVQYGMLEGKAQWEETKRRIGIQATLHPEQAGLPAIQLTGLYHPDSNSLNLSGDIRTFGLTSIAPYLSSFAHTVSGTASGKLQLNGPLPQLRISGNLHLDDAKLGIGYINTVYRMRDQDILLTDSSFVFDHLLFTDEDGHEGRLSGHVSHQQLQNYGVRLDIDAQNVMVLNTTYKDNDLFYGKAYGSGQIHLRQRPQHAFHLIGDLRTDKQTVVTILPGQNASVQRQQEYIVFEKPYSQSGEDGDTESGAARATTASANTNLQINLSITPEATVKVVLPPTIGCSILGNGSGNLRLELMDNHPFEIYGNYTLSEGNVDMALGNIFTRTLKLENGSSLSWNGIPDKGQMNVYATYTTKTSVSQLLSESGESAASYRSVPVTTGLRLNGELLNPEFSFRISLDEVDESLRSLVYNALDTTDKEAMFRQAFSLMMLGRFETQSTAENNNVNYLGYSLSELLSHYLQKMMSTLTENVNLGFLYRPGDGVSNGDEYNVQLSTNLMENRLSIRGNLDIYGDNSTAREKQAVAGNVVGDIIIEYKITQDGSLKVKVFNMANYYDVLSSAYSDVPYYQGIGIAYTKDFNTLKELFRKKQAGTEKKQ